MAKFKTRARAVDMLGRQQIAGVANAISELFKNAYDAYADNVKVDYFESDGLFVLRDDGVGMTKEDFLNRWLTIGTESKVAGEKGIEKPYKDKNKKPRIIMGDKGIGRLAIAIIGPQVLILTRAERDDGLKELVGAYIHWGLFEAPGVDLEDIEIPVQTYPGGELPSVKEVASLVNIVRKNTNRLSKSGAIDTKRAKKILTDIDNFKPDVDKLESALGTPVLTEKGRGTHFYILPSNETIGDDLAADMNLKANEYSQLSKLLIGFSNTMSPGKGIVPIETSVRYWKTNDSSMPLFDKSDFWTNEELKKADHRITGKFDKNGQFVGTVRIYDKTYKKHVIPAPVDINPGVFCGSFEIDFAYVMGKPTESGLTTDDFALIKPKLNRIGGLYIYKDGIRILPYGDADYDYLEIEKRRTLGAGYYFFSHRRIFGVIRLTNMSNSRLIEKAGREGFQANKAYREFKKILINFFLQLAADFFRDDASRDYYQEKKDELVRLDKALKEQKKEANKKRRDFKKALSIFHSRINDAIPNNEAINITTKLEEEVAKAIKTTSEKRLISAESRALSDLQDLRESYRIDRPGGIGLTKELKRNWAFYQDEYQNLDEKLFTPTAIQIGKISSQAAEKMKISIDERQRVEVLTNDTFSKSTKSIEMKFNDTQNSIKELQNKLDKLILQSRDEIKSTTSSIEEEIRKMDFSKDDRETINQKLKHWEGHVLQEVQGYEAILSHILNQLENINWYRDDEGYLIGNAEMTAALEEEVLGLRETVDISLESAQLGKAIEVISHEFNFSIATVRENIFRLKNWADMNPELKPIYNNLLVSFNHLDDYLKLFTPLQRRLQRTRTDISGAEIYNYLNRLFADRLLSEEITLEANEAFKKKQIFGFRSAFYPVFINLIDNAVYWLQDQRGPKIISLDANKRDLIVSDTGPGIDNRDREAIFERGFTRKPGGTGLGLFISRLSLKEEGFELILSDEQNTNGAKFIIRKVAP